MARRIDHFMGDTRARILRLLRRSPRTIADLADALGISGNAVRTHMASLQSDGLVREVGTATSTGGKPARIHDLTTTAEELFPKAYPLVLEALISALERRDGREQTIAFLREVGARVARQSAEDGHEDPGRRVRAAAEILEAIGGEVRIDETEEGWEIRGYGCPLSAVVVDRPDACALAQGVIEEVTGRVVVERCDREGRPRCGFCVTHREL